MFISINVLCRSSFCLPCRVVLVLCPLSCCLYVTLPSHSPSSIFQVSGYASMPVSPFPHVPQIPQGLLPSLNPLGSIIAGGPDVRSQASNESGEGSGSGSDHKRWDFSFCNKFFHQMWYWLVFVGARHSRFVCREDSRTSYFL